ncbi:hypothetical protein [Celerinatantimonas sp. MCCC 1A17872]|uniref:hypothetical protein n=1 Tax=Celerinatantimonas sp. MCCC 1A17872 TaxID=3177514 RepID=UPI0038C26B3F
MFKSEALNFILEAELKAGNTIFEQSAWPPKCSKLIILKNRFSKNYDSALLTYRRLDEPHYWYSEYLTLDGDECIACR